MDDSFQFIIESPQHNQGHKKRPRLVTSCDNCRLKKIKCLQPSPEAKCEACRAAKVPCRFRDREKYFAERSRAIAGPNIGSTYGSDQRSEGNPSLDAFSVASSSSSPSISSHSDPRSSSHSPRANGVLRAQGESNGRFQSYPPDPRRTDSPDRHGGTSSTPSFHPSRNSDQAGYTFLTSPSQLLPSSHGMRPAHQHSSRNIRLFDPEHPQFPHPSLMPHFIQLFFEQLGAEFAFISYEEILGEFWEQTLSPLLANCIAAMAARYSTLSELTVRGLHDVAETYADNAKTMLSSVAHIPMTNTLHALMLLSWSEYKSNRMAGFRAYSQMAMKMAIDLGLSDQNAIQVTLDENERNRRRSTWASIVQLHLTASSFRP